MRTAKIVVLLDDQDKIKVANAANAEGLDMSTWVRRTILQRLDTLAWEARAREDRDKTVKG